MANFLTYTHSPILLPQALDLHSSSPSKMKIKFYTERSIASSYDTKVAHKKPPNRTSTFKKKIYSKTQGAVGVKRYF